MILQKYQLKNQINTKDYEKLEWNKTIINIVIETLKRKIGFKKSFKQPNSLRRKLKKITT